jgi:hypothetical protein
MTLQQERVYRAIALQQQWYAHRLTDTDCIEGKVEVEVEVEVKLRPTVSRLVRLGVRNPSGTRDQFFFLLEIFFRQLRACYFVEPSLTRGRVCNLLLLLVLASAVPLGSESRGTQDHILLSQFLKIPHLGGPGPVFISPRNRVAQIYPRALGSLYASNSSDIVRCIRCCCLATVGKVNVQRQPMRTRNNPLSLTLSIPHNWYPYWQLSLPSHLLHAGFMLG